jgi:hypothetical protein
MNTEFLLLAQYNGRAVIPLDDVIKDYFPHLNKDKFLRKHASGELDVPLFRIEESQKAAKGIHISDLAAYVDRRRESALREQRALHS